MTTSFHIKLSQTFSLLMAGAFCLTSPAFALSTTQSNNQATNQTDNTTENLAKPILVESTPLPINTVNPQKPLSAFDPTLANDPALKVIATTTIKGQNVTLPLGILNKISEAGLNPADISILIQPLSAKENDKPPALLISHQPHVPRTPASTQKLIPTFIALDTLGADFSWHTKVFQQGWLIGDTLHGNIVIQGSGDPRLNHEQLYALLGGLKKYGIKHIDGDILLDNSIFENVNFNPSAFDGQGLRAYNAPPNGLLINFGTVQVDFMPSGTLPLLSPTPLADSSTASVSASVTAPIVTPQSGNEAENMESSQTNTPAFYPNPSADTAAVRLLPPLADYTAPSVLPISHTDCGKTPFVKPSVTKDSLNFSGQITSSCGKQSWWFTFPDSNELVKKSVKGTWLQLDPTFHGNVRFITAKDKMALPTFSKFNFPLPIVDIGSPPLSRQIWDINHFSNNVMTEQVTLSLPIYAKTDGAGKQATSSYPKAFDFIHTWWQKTLPNTAPPVMTRGSGLCRDCQVEPASMLALLNYAYHGQNFDVFKESMGIAGVSGTMKALKKRQPDSPAIGNAWIKTGTLNDVSSMVGYVKGKSGNWYAVVGMVNTPNAGHDYRVKAILDDMLAWAAIQ